MKAPSFPTTFFGNAADKVRWTWSTSLVLYVIFAAIVFLVQGSRPLLGPDHVTYFQLADSIINAHPAGDYWRETDSVRSFGVLLAYFHTWTASHILSMKLILAAASVLYLLSAELLFGLFTNERWQAILFAVLSAFAVSFGISSWGVTDSIALLPRTLVAPIIMLSIWFWLRFYDRPVKYLVFSFLIIGSLLHLSTFYVAGLLGLLELWDFVAIRKFRIDARVPAFLGGLALAATILYLFESLNISVKIIHALIPHLFSATKFAVDDVPVGADHASNALQMTTEMGVPRFRPRTAAVSARDAWALELGLRPWRNMPLRLANVANVLSSCALVLILALYGVVRARRAGFTPTDRFMVAMFVAIPTFAFLPQTILWVLRSFTDVYPTTIEEVRAIGFIMIPALYFVLRLLQQILADGGPYRNLKAAAVMVAVVALPLTVKSFTPSTREAILSAMTALHMVDSTDATSVANARSALGIAHSTPFYYSTQGVIQWSRENTPPNSRILTDRDELVLLRDREIVGPRQVAAVPPRAGVELPGMTQIFFETERAIQSHDLAEVQGLAMTFGADFVVVPWRVDGAPYHDDYFSVVPVPRSK
jgi:hypothetical protein